MTLAGGAGVVNLTGANNFVGAVKISNSGANNVAVTDTNAIVLARRSLGTSRLAAAAACGVNKVPAKAVRMRTASSV